MTVCKKKKDLFIDRRDGVSLGGFSSNEGTFDFNLIEAKYYTVRLIYQG